MRSFRGQFFAGTTAAPCPTRGRRSCRRHVLERDQRKLGDRPASSATLTDADMLRRSRPARPAAPAPASVSVRLAGLALRQRQVAVGEEARPDLRLGALPHPQRGHRLARLVQLHGIERLEAAVQELLASAARAGIGVRAQHDRQEPPLAALARRRRGTSRRLRCVRSSSPSTYGSVHKQPVAVGLRDVVVAKFLLRVERVVLGVVADQRGRELRQVARPSSSAAGRTARSRWRNACSSCPSRAASGSSARRTPVLAAGDELGERDRRIVARLDDHPAQQLVDATRSCAAR